MESDTKIEFMHIKHLEEVYSIECESFSVPWSKSAFRYELEENKHSSIYLVAIVQENVVGYIGMRQIIDEGHITNIAVKEKFRKNGIGDKLLKELLKISKENELIGITLEVRIGNLKAQKLYTGNGFIPEGFRKNYYTDPLEDAIVMWKYF